MFLQVIGSIPSVQDALFHITSRIRETIFLQKPHASGAANPYMSASPDVPLLRSRNEPTLGLSHGLDSIGRESSAPHTVDRLGVDRVPFTYGSDAAGHRSFDHSPSPRSWGPQASFM